MQFILKIENYWSALYATFYCLNLCFPFLMTYSQMYSPEYTLTTLTYIPKSSCHLVNTEKITIITRETTCLRGCLSLEGFEIFIKPSQVNIDFNSI